MHTTQLSGAVAAISLRATSMRRSVSTSLQEGGGASVARRHLEEPHAQYEVELHSGLPAMLRLKRIGTTATSPGAARQWPPGATASHLSLGTAASISWTSCSNSASSSCLVTWQRCKPPWQAVTVLQRRTVGTARCTALLLGAADSGRHLSTFTLVGVHACSAHLHACSLPSMQRMRPMSMLCSPCSCSSLPCARCGRQGGCLVSSSASR